MLVQVIGNEGVETVIDFGHKSVVIKDRMPVEQNEQYMTILIN